MKKIITILGARPQFIKAAVLSSIYMNSGDIEEVIIHTGQHYDARMSAVFFQEMGIPEPQYNLNVNGLGHGAMTGQMLEKIEAVLVKEKPDMVVVFGDTNSTLAGALAASKMHIKLAHVEAGLRSFNMKMPEEINRILTDRISDILFCPTPLAVKNLNEEGYMNFDTKVVESGDIMKDALAHFSVLSDKQSELIAQMKLKPNGFILATIHRQENTDDPEVLRSVITGLERINEEIEVVLPLHPRTKSKLEAFGIDTSLTCIEPVGYLDMIALLKNTALVITDSGGLQKEAFFSGKHCVVVREETEWVELVTNGFAIVAGRDQKVIYDSYKILLEKSSDFSLPLYGNKVGEFIYKELLKML